MATEHTVFDTQDLRIAFDERSSQFGLTVTTETQYCLVVDHNEVRFYSDIRITPEQLIEIANNMIRIAQLNVKDEIHPR